MHRTHRVRNLAVVRYAERIGDLGVRLLLYTNDHVEILYVRVLRDQSLHPSTFT